jgi:hypothetical protein
MPVAVIVAIVTGVCQSVWERSEVKMVKVKVKCTLVQVLRLCIGRTAYRGNKGIALLLHDQRH